MEQPLLLQGGQFLYAVALGAALGIFYDLLRGLRRSLRVLTPLLDFLYALTVLLSGLLLALYVGNGQYRLFLLVGTVLGAAIYFLTISRIFSAASCTIWRFLTYPPRAFGRFCKKIAEKLQKFLKNIFSTEEKSAKINRRQGYSQEAQHHASAKGPVDRHARPSRGRAVRCGDDLRVAADDQSPARRRGRVDAKNC